MKVFDIKLTKVDYISVTFILVQLFILILNWSHLPTAELDTPYHLLMGKMFSDYDTVMLWDYYEYAPTGRPHLYPPLEHILLWWMHDITGADWWNIGRFISLIQYPLPLFTVWFFSRKLFNPVTALASLVFLSISEDFWFWQVSVAPTALIISLFPLYLYSFYKKKVFTSIILLSSFLYLHLGLPYVIIFSTFIFSLFSLYKTREYLKQFAVVTGASALIFLPWIIHILMYREWLSSSSRQVFDPFSLLVGINLLTAAFFILGMWKCLREARIDMRYLLVLSTAIGFLAIALYGWRYKMHSPIINCIVGGIGFELVYTRIMAKTAPVSRKKVAAVVLLLLIPLGAFSLTLTSKLPLPGQPQQPRTPHQQLPGQLQQPLNQQPGQLPQQFPGQQPPPLNNQNQPPRQPQLRQSSFLDLLRNPQIRIQPSPLVEMLTSLKTGERPPRVWQITNPQIDELIEWISDNTSPDDILHLSNGMLADYLALFTDRRTDAGMYREVSSSEMFKAIQEGRKSGIFIIEVDQFKEQNPPGLTVLEQFGNLLVMQGIRSEKIPQEITLRLEELFILLERPEPSLVDRWIRVIQEVRPRTIYIGVRQKDVKTPELQEFIDALTPLCNVGLSIIVEDESIKNMTLPPGITTLRLVIPQDKISLSFIEAVDRNLDPKINFEIAVIGPPFFENKKVYESLLQVLPLVDRVVRHVSPNIESISITQEEERILGKKFFLQIDTYRGQFEITPEELYTLLQAAARITMNKTIIEFKYPPATLELINFLKNVYAV